MSRHTLLSCRWVDHQAESSREVRQPKIGQWRCFFNCLFLSHIHCAWCQVDEMRTNDVSFILSFTKIIIYLGHIGPIVGPMSCSQCARMSISHCSTQNSPVLCFTSKMKKVGLYVRILSCPISSHPILSYHILSYPFIFIFICLMARVVRRNWPGRVFASRR